MCELAEQLESYSKMFEWRISIRSRGFKWNDDKFRDYDIRYDEYTGHYYFYMSGDQYKEYDVESCYCNPVINKFEEGISDIKEDDLTMTIVLLWKTEDIEEEHRQVRLSSKEEWKDHVLDFMSGVEYIINRRRYARTKRATSDS